MELLTAASTKSAGNRSTGGDRSKPSGKESESFVTGSAEAVDSKRVSLGNEAAEISGSSIGSGGEEGSGEEDLENGQIENVLDVVRNGVTVPQGRLRALERE